MEKHTLKALTITDYVIRKHLGHGTKDKTGTPIEVHVSRVNDMVQRRRGAGPWIIIGTIEEVEKQVIIDLVKDRTNPENILFNICPQTGAPCQDVRDSCATHCWLKA